MEQEMEKQTNANVKKNKLKLVIIIIIALIVLLLAVTSLKYFLTRNNTEITSNDNQNRENIIEETNSPDISELPSEETETNTDNTENDGIDKNIVQEPENNTGTSEESATTPPVNNANTDSTTSSNSNPPVSPSTNANSNNNSNTNSNENNNTSGNNNTTPTPTTPSTPVVTPYVVKTETSTELSKSETKYGVVINTYTTSTYDIYSDGNKKITYSFDKVEYDNSNYHASTSELLSDAVSAKNQYNSMLTQVLNNVNSYREEANDTLVDSVSSRSNLTLNEDLCIAACARAVEMAYSSKFSHTRPNGSTCFTILDEMGIYYSTAGENIASGYSNADSVSVGWKNSQGHYKNMISSAFSQIGIGVFQLEGTYYWVQLFN